MIILIISYLIGSIPCGLIIAKLAGLGDIRKIGSGNIGATNALRTGNRFVAILTLILDVAKGIVPILAAQKYNGNVCLAGILAVIGHIFPVWLKFRGGKGVATSFGVLAALNWKICIIVLLVWLAIFKLCKYSSLSSIVAMLTASCVSLIYSTESEFYTIPALSLITILRHKQNIVRLINRQEPKISAG
jgi:glycerol-3-phosphate acyltransferase PlsY